MARKIYPNHPKCVNHGCESFVILQGLDKQGNPKYRPHCATCQKASWGGGSYKAGVTPFKKGECSNKDGHLGFKCLIKWSLVPNWATGMTEIDHIDGNHANNSLSNLQELCPICHKLKGQMEGDYKGFRYKR